MSERTIHEDDDVRITESTSPGWPNQRGSTRTVRTEAKPGGPTAAAQAEEGRDVTLRGRAVDALDAMRQARAVATNIADTTGPLTTLQMSQAIRALARGQALLLTVGIQVVRLVARKLDADD